MRKPIAFLGSSLDDLREFPDDARAEAGFQLDKVQQGIAPDDWKPFGAVGPGACEIRIRDDVGAFRVLYVARFVDTIYVLHAFQKKSQQTAQRDIDLAKARYRQMTRSRR